MRVLGIDPGFGRCGVAVVEKANGTEVLLYSACIETSPKAPFGERLHEVVSTCAKLIDTYAPDAIALEKLYFSNNQKTAMQVAEVRGALLAEAARARVPVSEYSPNEVKVAVASSGRADKKQMETMLRMLLKLDATPRLDDEFDAIGIAVTHLAQAKTYTA